MRISSLLPLALLSFAYGCNLSAISAASFHRVDESIGGFTKHYRESEFQLTAGGAYSIELLVRSFVKVGENEFLMIVHDRGDRDVEGAAVSVGAQGMGPSDPMNVKPAGDQGGGRYRVEGLQVIQAGPVNLRVRIEKSGVEDEAVLQLVAKRVPTT